MLILIHCSARTDSLALDWGNGDLLPKAGTVAGVCTFVGVCVKKVRSRAPRLTISKYNMNTLFDPIHYFDSVRFYVVLTS